MAFRALRLFRRGQGGFRILLFHDTPPETFKDFDVFIEYMKRTHGVITPGQAASWLGGRKPSHESYCPCLFSFDDGFASNFTLAAEILQKHEIKALFFVCPGLASLDEGNQRQMIAANIFNGRIDAASLPLGLRLMSFDEMAELTAEGHVIGAHGLSHQKLSRLTGGALLKEIITSGEILKDRLGRAVDWFAYPFGDIESISKEALEIIADHYRFCRSGVRGVNSSSINRCALLADHMDISSPMAFRQLILEGGLEGRYALAKRRLDKMAGHGDFPPQR